MWFYLIVVLTILLVILDRGKPEKFKKVHEKLGCDFLYMPIIGHCHIFFGSKRRVKKYVDIVRQCYRNKHGMISFWVANRLFVGISDPLQARIVLKTCLDKGLSELTVDVIGNISAFAPVQQWRHRRKVTVAALAPRFIKNFVDTFSRHSEDLCDKLNSKVLQGDLSTTEYFCDYTFETILEATVGDKISKNQQYYPVKKAIDETMENFIRRIGQPWKHINAVYKLTEDYRRQMENKKIIRNFIIKLILEKKALTDMERIGTSEYQEENSQNKHLLELIMDFSGDSNDITDEVLEEVVQLIVASTDTTTVTAGFISVILSLYPDVQDKAYDEIKTVVQDPNRKLIFEDLDKFKYLEAVIKEVIRLYPSGPILLRKCDNDLALPNGFILPTGTDVLINVLGINRHPKYWGLDADEFRPERFMEGAPSHPAALMSFSYGPRNCAGQNFAMMSLKTLFAHILRRYRLKPGACYKNLKVVDYVADIMLRPMKDFVVNIETRY